MSIHEFTPTGEQQAIIDAVVKDRGERTKVQAFAGGGKTSLLQMLAARSADRGLYLAFNKRNADEAQRKFPRQVECRTTHSLAYRAVGYAYKHKLNGRITGRQLADELAIRGGAELTPAHVARAVQQVVRRFCASADPMIDLQHCRDDEAETLLRREAKRRVEAMDTIAPDDKPAAIERRVSAELTVYRQQLRDKARQLWARWVDTTDPMTMEHDGYLKLFQMDEPRIRGFDYLMLDEAQDTSDCVLDILLRQAAHSRLVAVGDTYQQLYSWRGACNAMEKLDDFRELLLSQSFRFGPAIAEVANRILNQRFTLPTPLKGFEGRASTLGPIDPSQPYAFIARGNKTLLHEALALLQEDKRFAVIRGTAEMASLLESLYWLYKDDRAGITHDAVRMLGDWSEALEEADADPELKRLIELVADLRDDTVRMADRLRRMDRVDPRTAPIVLSTGHASKGLEFSQVVLADDFCRWNPSQWKPDMASDEDWRILYVAATRALDRLEPNRLIEGLA